MAAAGKVAGVNPNAWKIIDGALFLYWDQKAGEKFSAKSDANIKKADENWAKLNNE